MDKIDLEYQAEAEKAARKKAEEEYFRPNQLLPKNILFERYKKELEQEFATYRKQQTDGAAALAQSLQKLSQEMPSLFSEEVIEGLNRLARLSEIIDRDEAAYTEHLTNGGTLQELAQVNNSTMDKLYLGAKRLFNQSSFTESADAFAFLTRLNHKKYFFWLGLGYSEFRRGHYKEAIEAFKLACAANPSDPTSQITVSHCYEETGQPDLALEALDKALSAIQGKEEYADWQEMIRQEKARLIKGGKI